MMIDGHGSSRVVVTKRVQRGWRGFELRHNVKKEQINDKTPVK
jgi:hypothetical protein